MTGSWHGGKGSDPRPEAEPGAFARGFDAIDWEARARELVKANPTAAMAVAIERTDIPTAEADHGRS